MLDQSEASYHRPSSLPRLEQASRYKAAMGRNASKKKAKTEKFHWSEEKESKLIISTRKMQFYTRRRCLGHG